MTARKNKFHYGRSFKVVHWGCRFDSLTELKFAISIQDDYEFIGGRVTIHYERKTLYPTEYITDRCSSYTPDFLIRHRKTGEAFLVEVKPRAAESDSQLTLRRQVAENYIKWKGYDWKYKIVFDDEIILNETELVTFEDCCKLKSQSAFSLWLLEQHKRYNKDAPTFFARIPRNSDIRYVMFGTRTEKQGWNNTK